MFKKLLIKWGKHVIMQSPSKSSILGTEVLFGRYYVYLDILRNEWVIERNKN